MPTERIRSLVDRFFMNDCTPAEKEELAAWIDQAGDDHELKELLSSAWERHAALEAMPGEMSDRVLMNVFRHEKVRRMPRRWMAAAVLIGLLGIGMWWWSRPADERKTMAPVAVLTYKGDVAPGHSGAILHLSNGQEVVLDSAQNGTIAVQGGMQAVKENGSLRYTGQSGEVIYNDVTTAPGRQWRLTLPDGTRVWLNAASSIHYPLTFKGDVREVSITGEAYFEVAHHAGQAFRVKVGDQVIEDVGTAFNINAYDDEPVVKTTLAEGAIRVRRGTASVLVKPGEQVRLQEGQLKVSEGDVLQATAWRRGIFSCRHAGIPELMRQLARWYNVEVEYKSNISPEITFTGDMSRSLSLAQVLHGLRGMDVHFRIEEDKKIVVLP